MQVAFGSRRHHGWRGRTAAALVCACALLLAACGGDDGGTDQGSGSQQGSASGGGASLKGRTLVVASWGGAWTDNAKKFFYDPFAKETGVKVVVNTPGGGFGSRVTAQQDTGNVQWDLLDSPSTDTTLLQVQGRLETFPPSLVQTIEPLVRPGSIRPSTAQPHHLLHGQTADVIACNPKRVAKCPKTPQEFFDVKNFPGRRGISTGTPVFPLILALEADGVQPEQLFPLDLPRAIRKLNQIKPNVAVWASTASQSQQTLADGEVDISYLANGRAFLVKKDVIPELELSWQGAPMADEGWCVPKDAPNKDVAFAFIEWYAKHPENQAGFTKALNYMTPTKQLIELIPAEVAEGLPVNKQGVVQIDGAATAKQAKEIGQALQQVLVG